MDLSRIVSASIDGRTHNTRYRQSQFHRLQSVLVEHIVEVQDAIRGDSGHSREEVRAEVVLALQELRAHYASLSLQKDLDTEYRIAHGKDNADGSRGVGIVYVVPCTHTQFFAVISALTAALAAGNCIVVELPQTTMALPGLLRRILPDALDHDTFAVVTQRPGALFLEKALTVAQTKTNVPNALQSPASSRVVAIVDRTANVTEAAKALVTARFAFGGRSVYSPDLVLVNEFAIQPFIEMVIQQASKYLAGENGEERQQRLLPRRSGLLDSIHKDQSAKVLVSGSDWAIVEVHDRNSPLLQKKIGEKVLLVHAVTSLDDAIDMNSNQTLAATYVFAVPAAAKYLTQFIDADISWVNHVPSHMLIGPALPRNTAYVPNTRYALSSFQQPRPQIITPAACAKATQTILESTNGLQSDALWRQTIASLPSTKQRPGLKIGYFEQGIISGGILTLTTLVAAVSTLGYYTLVLARKQV